MCSNDMSPKKKVHFEISERKILLRIVDSFLVLLTVYLVGYFTGLEYFQVSEDSYSWMIVLAFYLSFFTSIFELYNLQIASNQFETIRNIVFVTIGTVVFYMLTPYLTLSLPSNRIQILYFVASIIFPLLVWRLFYINFLASHRFLKKVILICDVDQLDELVYSLEKVDPNYKIIGHLNTNSSTKGKTRYKLPQYSLKELESQIYVDSVSEIVVASQKAVSITVEIYNVLINLIEKGVQIREFSQVYEEMTYRIPVHYADRDFYRYFPFSRSNQNKLYRTIIRLFEIVFSIIGLVVCLGVIPIVWLGNLLGNRGPLFYKQERVGLNGVSFEIYKFRSMVTDAEKDGAVFATKNDSRVTKFGKFLRKTRIDEFPQFINILRGEMAVIGPRPERPFFVKEISEIMPFYETRHVVKPGLTGWAQVNYSYGESIDESLIKLQYDLFYIKHRSLFLDLNIILKTISTVVFYRGH